MRLFQWPRSVDKTLGHKRPYLPPKVTLLKGSVPSPKATHHVRLMLQHLDQRHALRIRPEEQVKGRRDSLLQAAARRAQLLHRMGLDVPMDRDVARELLDTLEAPQ